jgi:malonate-semialdehyde dehydrogenase (acetylating)/methylmalonate-semialdehyde dehydrogenase
MSTTSILRTITHWVAGSPVEEAGERRLPIWDPATGDQQAEVVLGEQTDVDAAVAAAVAASDAWRDSSLAARARVLFAFRSLVERDADEIARLISSEHGKVIADSRAEVVRAIEMLEYACGIPELLKGEYSDQVSTDLDCYSLRQPLGVCAGITPFNFPLLTGLWMHPMAIATGNAFVLKPSERDPSVANLIAELYAEAGLPAGVFNVVHGDKVAVDALLDHPDVDAISFVGSSAIAKYVYSRGAAQGKRVQALGGAKNHAIVLPDADVDFAADQLISAAYGTAGQRCMAVSVVVAVGEAADPLVKGVGERARAIEVGPGLDPGSEMGPVVTGEARDRISAYIAKGVEQGAQAVVDGRDVDIQGNGFWVGPTVLDHVTPEMDVYTDEIFGPVLSVVRVSTLDDAIRLTNSHRYGNGAAIFTSSGGAARTFARSIKAGMVGVNVSVPVPMAYHSFGGWKDSLFGDRHIQGPEGVSFYTRGKTVTTRWPAPAESDCGSTLSFPTAS